MASNGSGPRKRKATDSFTRAGPTGDDRKRPRSDATGEAVWPVAWVNLLLEFTSSGATLEQCARLSGMVKRAVAAVPAVLASWSPPTLQGIDRIEQYLNSLEAKLTKYVSEAPETTDPDDPYGTYAVERESWHDSWRDAWKFLVANGATTEELARYRRLVTTSKDYSGDILDECEPPQFLDDQTVTSYLNNVEAGLDEGIRDIIDEDDDRIANYANAQKSWPQPWKDARNALTNARASTDQRATFRDAVLAVTDGLPSALQFVEPPFLDIILGVDAYLMEVRARLRAQEVLRERRATPVQRVRLVESLQKAINIDSEILNSWTAPTPEANQLLSTFLQGLESSLQAHKMQWVTDLWEKSISDALDAGAMTRDLMRMRTRLDAMIAYAARGGEPYKPDENLPADADQETDLPSFAALTQDYSFQGPNDGDLPGSWRWQGSIGEGGNGYAGIWLQFDSAGKTVHRVVVKDNYLPGPSWDWPQFWYDIAARVPIEAALARKLSQCRDSSNIVACYGHKTHAARRMFRIYLEYRPHGDLEDLIHEHVQIREQRFRDSKGNLFEYRIPIPALWAIFEALAAAACLMHKGRLPGTPANPEWSALLHMDIKPHNIFLSPPDLRNWRGIPTAKLGDFGLITEIRSEGISNNGTDGYIAPEREAADTHDLDQSLKQPERSNVSDIWSIGRVMHSLINLHQDVAPWYDSEMDNDGFPKYSDGVREYYENSAWDLLDVLDGCLAPDPQERTTASELWDQIQEEVRAGDDMKLAPLAANQVLWYKRDQYALWAR